MQPKLLSRQQQMGIFNSPKAVELMREYISYSKDFMFVAQRRKQTASLQKFIQWDKTPVTETQKKIFLNLSLAQANRVCSDIGGTIYPDVLLQMLNKFPKNIVEELLLEYGKNCTLPKKVIIKSIDVFGKDVENIIFLTDHLDIDIFNYLLSIFSEDCITIILLAWVKRALQIDKDVELKIVHLYSDKNLKRLLKGFLSNGIRIENETFAKIFEICSSQKEIKNFIALAIKNDLDIGLKSLEKIIEVFPPDEAKVLLQDFFDNTSSGRDEYSYEEKENLYKALRIKKNRL